MPWWVAALLSAACWGMQYMLLEHFFRRLDFAASLTFLTLANGLIVTAVLCYLHPHQDWSVLWQGVSVPALLALYLLCGSSAYILTAYAIRDKDATYASLLEITYPLFIVVFTALFLGKVHLDLLGFLGALLILVGCGLVLWSQAG